MIKQDLLPNLLRKQNVPFPYPYAPILRLTTKTRRSTEHCQTRLVNQFGSEVRGVKFLLNALVWGTIGFLVAVSNQCFAAEKGRLPYFIMAKRQGFNVLGTAVDVLEMATVGIATSTRKIQQEREQVRKMVRSQLDTMRWIKSQRSEVVQFLRLFFALDEETASESYEIYSRLMIEDGKILPQAIHTVLEQEGKAQFPLERVADGTIVEEVLRERR